jgi:hypothetical protein
VFRVVAEAEMHGYLYYSAFQRHSLPGIQEFPEPPATICAHTISHQLARWLLRNLSIILIRSTNMNDEFTEDIHVVL